MSDYRDNPNINFVYAHASGHAAIENLQSFTSSINAKKVLPIHTEYGME
jgi:ribonuclease J